MLSSNEYMLFFSPGEMILKKMILLDIKVAYTSSVPTNPRAGTNGTKKMRFILIELRKKGHSNS
jgi:hypothetical protein